MTVSATNGQKLLMRDVELAPLIGVSAQFLRIDRRTHQRIPFIKLGDRCLYNLDRVRAALDELQVGGTTARKRQRAAV